MRISDWSSDVCSSDLSHWNGVGDGEGGRCAVLSRAVLSYSRKRSEENKASGKKSSRFQRHGSILRFGSSFAPDHGGVSRVRLGRGLFPFRETPARGRFMARIETPSPDRKSTRLNSSH